MDNWFDRDNPFEDEEGLYDDTWFKPCVDEWRSIHPLGFNPYDWEHPWGAWSDDTYHEEH